MYNKCGEIKVICSKACPEETVGEFNKKIAEIIFLKYSREIIDKFIDEYDDNHREKK